MKNKTFYQGTPDVVLADLQRALSGLAPDTRVLIAVQIIGNGFQHLRFQELLNQKGLTQEQFAQLLTQRGCPAKQVTVSTWLRGERVPSLEKILAIAQCLDVPLSELWH